MRETALPQSPAMKPSLCRRLLQQSHHRTPLLAAGCLCALLSAACQSSGPPPAAKVLPSAAARHWVKVSSQPPTFYPRGAARDCPTDYRSGDWVQTGDAAGTRYFVPVGDPGGHSSRALLDEALAMQTDRKLAQTAAEDGKGVGNFLKKAPVLIPLNLLVMLGQGRPLGVAEFDALTERWRDEWHTSKAPKEAGSGWTVSQR